MDGAWASLSAFSNENELLASLDIDHPGRDSISDTVTESEVSEAVSNENTELSRKQKETEICKYVNRRN